MQVYRTETREIVRRFLRHKISFPECIAALDAAVAALMPRLKGEDIPKLHIEMPANNEVVMKEMERRGLGDSKA